MSTATLPPIWSWHDFIERASAPDTIRNGSGRRADDGWAGATWDEAIALATGGWAVPLPEVDVAVAALRDRLSDQVKGVVLAPVWDVTGSEVDVAAFLSGVPECMTDSVPRKLSSHGRVVTLLVPATYSNTVPHAEVVTRGVALAALCSAVITAAHSVEVWSGYAVTMPLRQAAEDAGRYSAVARVVSAGEPLDVARLMFAMAHPAMLRRLWFSVWDSAQRSIAQRMPPNNYGYSPNDCTLADLPDQVHDAYVLPPLVGGQPQWQSSDSAVSWCIEAFAGLGLITGLAPRPPGAGSLEYGTPLA